jgi:choline dehydrogenase-like flavoprotein
MDHDFLIVGGGTAGAVIASRLSENPAHRVLLLEAGDDILPGREPADIQDPFPAATLNPHYFWDGLTATARDGGTPARYPQARVMGGGSSINGLFALRGVPSDYARWGAAGARASRGMPCCRTSARSRTTATGAMAPATRTPSSAHRRPSGRPSCARWNRQRTARACPSCPTSTSNRAMASSPCPMPSTPKRVSPRRAAT